MQGTGDTPNDELKPVYVFCPWQALRFRDGAMRCEAFVRWSINQGYCAGEKCEQYVAWKEVFNGRIAQLAKDDSRPA